MRWLLWIALVACGDNGSGSDAALDDAAPTDSPGDAPLDVAPFCGDGIVGPDEECDVGLRGLSGDGCSSTCKTETFVVRVTDREPLQQRNAHTLAYDSQRERVVMFGGFRDNVALDDTWELAGETWTQVATTTRPPGGTWPMFYEHGRVILVETDGTWAWNGTTWSELTVATPPTGTIRESAFDLQRDVGVLLTSTGTWEWDGDDWELVDTTAPSMIVDIFEYAGSGRVALVSLFEMWQWDGATWTRQDIVPPTNAIALGATFDPIRGRLIASASVSDSWQQQLFAWTGATWQHLSTPGDGPAARQTEIVFDDDSDRLVLSAALTPWAPDSWAWNGSSWHRIYAGDPPFRYSPYHVFDQRLGHVAVLGGIAGSSLRDDEWSFLGGVWSQLSRTRPSPRITYGTAYDEHRQRAILVGGQTNYHPDVVEKAFDVWELSDTGWQRRFDAPLSATDSFVFVAAYDRTNHHTLIVTSGHTWTWDGTTMIERSAPPAFVYGSMAYDARRGITVLAADEGLYEWTGALWQSVSDELANALLVYDPLRAVIIAETNAGMWEWDGTSVTSLAASSHRPGVTGVYDRRSRSWFETGGISGLETLAARWDSGEPDEKCDGTDADGDGLARCDDPDCYWRCTPSCPPYASCDPTAPRCGDGTCTAIEDAALCPADCP